MFGWMVVIGLASVLTLTVLRMFLPPRPRWGRVGLAVVLFWGLIVAINVVAEQAASPLLDAGDDLARRTAATNLVIEENNYLSY